MAWSKANLAFTRDLAESSRVAGAARPIHFIADDFGLSPEVNAAIVHAHREGVLTGASLMAGQPASAEAVELARQNPRLEIGWHVHLCDAQPLTLPTWPWGNGPALAGLRVGLTSQSRQMLRTELAAQWAFLRQTGLRCAFINSHHHLHLHPLVLSEIRHVVGDAFDGWLRGTNYQLFSPTNLTARITRWSGCLLRTKLERSWPAKRSEAVWGVDRLHRMNAEEIRRVAETPPHQSHEFIFHPRRLENDADLETLMALKSCSNQIAV